LVRSEVRKLLSTRLWWGLLLGVAFTSIGFAVLFGLVAGVGDDPVTPGLEDPAVVRGVYTAGLQASYLFALALGVIAMAGEYRHQTITATFLACPRRSRVVGSKLVAVGGMGLVYGVATVAGGLVGGVPVVALRDAETMLASNGVPRALLLAVLATGLWAVLGLGVGTLLRNQILALLTAIGVAWIAEPVLALGLNAAGAGGVARYLPTQATTAIVSPSTESGGFTVDLLPWWAGALVLLAYAALAGALGVFITLRRDVT
jgi:ABC-type transport system involved in multi-copper enzyme maturation permease subunit